MKKVILASVVAVAAINANAASVSYCAGGTAMSFSVAAGTGTEFVRSQFTGRCSANVHLVGDDNASYYRVGSASGKGKQSFGGSTIGGGITGTNCASTTGCAASDASNAATNAASS